MAGFLVKLFLILGMHTYTIFHTNTRIHINKLNNNYYCTYTNTFLHTQTKNLHAKSVFFFVLLYDLRKNQK